MGVFTVKLTVWNPVQPQRTEEVEVWVDTGAGYSWILHSRLAGLGIQPSRPMQFRTIEGRVIERQLAPVFLRVNGYVAGDNVVLGEAGDLEVLGSHTLEALGVAADPVQKKLVPVIGLALATVLGCKTQNRFQETDR